MCRWLAYYGSPVLLDDILIKPEHSLIDQSLHAQMSDTTTNGDGFGIGWYAKGQAPFTYRSTEPAWNDSNLRELSRHVVSPLIFAHIRASTGGAVQQTNCHPFRHGNWLWMHNGVIHEFASIKRELAFAVDPSLFHEIEGSTDTEMFFFLALTFGLKDNPPLAVERAVGFIEKTGRAKGIEFPMQMTVATSDGDRIWVFRYSSEGKSRSLFYSTAVTALQAQYPDNPVFQKLSEESRLIVSEPLNELGGIWNELPESSYCVVQAGDDPIMPFKPKGI